MQQGYHPNQNPPPRRPAPAPQQGYQPQQQYQQPVGGYRESYFDGGILSSLWLRIVNGFILLLTVGFGLPWAVCRSKRWEQQHTVLDGHRLVFDGTGSELFGLWIVNWILTIITLGIYGLWAGRAVKRWVVRHTHLT